MPPAIAIAAAIGGGLAAFGVISAPVIFGSAFLGGAALFGGLALVSSFLAPKAGDFNFGSGLTIGSQRSDTRQLVRAGVQNAKWVLGRARLSGSLIYYSETVAMTPPDDEGNLDRSGTVHLVVAMCDGPIEGVERVFLNGTAVDDLSAGGVTIRNYGQSTATSSLSIAGIARQPGDNRIFVITDDAEVRQMDQTTLLAGDSIGKASLNRTFSALVARPPDEDGLGALLVGFTTGARARSFNINPDNPQDSAGDFGEGSRQGVPVTAASCQPRTRIIFAASGTSLYQMQGTMGIRALLEVGSFPASVNNEVPAMAFRQSDGALFIVHKSSGGDLDLWRINPDDPTQGEGTWNEFYSNTRQQGSRTWPGDAKDIAYDGDGNLTVADDEIYSWNGRRWDEVTANPTGAGRTSLYSMAVASNGDIHAYFRLVGYVKWDGTDWTVVTSTLPDGVRDPSDDDVNYDQNFEPTGMAVDANGHVFVWHHAANGTNNDGSTWSIAAGLWRFNGSSWSHLGGDIPQDIKSAGLVRGGSLAFNSSGQLNFMVSKSLGGRASRVLKWTGSAWGNVLISPFRVNNAITNAERFTIGPDDEIVFYKNDKFYSFGSGGEFGIIGSLPSSISDPQCMDFDQFDGLVVVDGDGSATLIDPDDLTSTSPVLGRYVNRVEILPNGSVLKSGVYPHLEITFFPNGIHSDLDQSLINIPQNDIEEIGPWTSDCLAKGRACAYVKMYQPSYKSPDEREWNRVPSLEFQIAGLKITWPGQATPVWTENAAALRYWWLTERRDVPSSAIDRASFDEAFAYCDHVIDNGITDEQQGMGFLPSSKRYTINGIVYSSDDHLRVEQEMDFAFAGNVVEVNGRHFFRPGQTRQADISITDDDIIQRGPIKLGPALTDRFNAVSMSLAQSLHDEFIAASVPEYQDQQAIARDGRRLPKDFGKRAFVVDKSTAGRLLAIHLRLARLSKRFEYSVYPRDDMALAGLIPSDRILLTDSVAGLTKEPMAVVARSINPDWSVSLTLEESPDGTYNDTAVLPSPSGSLTITESRTIVWPFSDTLRAIMGGHGTVTVDGVDYMSGELMASAYGIEIVISIRGQADSITLTPVIDKPSAISGLNSAASSDSIVWGWSASPGATSYEIRVSEGSTASGKWRSLGTDLAYRASNLDPSTEYTLEVRARNAGGATDAASDSATTLAGSA